MSPRVPPANKGRKLPPEPLSRGDVDLLLRACSPRTATGLRNRALIVLLWRSQLRIAEALALRPADLDPATGTVRVLHGKGDKCRVVGLDPEAFAVVTLWLTRREQLAGIGKDAPIICGIKGPGRSGKPLTTASARALLPRLARKAGITKRVHPHGLRHTGAFELANEGVPLHVIQAQLGHESLATTEGYISHLAATDVAAAMVARRWASS